MDGDEEHELRKVGRVQRLRRLLDEHGLCSLILRRLARNKAPVVQVRRESPALEQSEARSLVIKLADHRRPVR